MRSASLKSASFWHARYIFIGSLGKIGTRYILNINLVEVETGEALKSVSDKYNNLDSPCR